MSDSFAVVTACSYNLFHAPYFAMEHGTTTATERQANPDSAFLKALPGRLRSFAEVSSYAPNQVFIGNLDPRDLPPRPWHSLHAAEARSEGLFGRILDEKKFYALVKFADIFDLVLVTNEFRDEALALLQADDALRGADLSRFKSAADSLVLQKELAEGALPLMSAGKTLGCIKSAHPFDVNLGAHTMLENLSAKATAAYALRRLLADNRIDPGSIDYVIETSEEACGDMNQRGGGNFAKAVGELAALTNATGSDVRSFCAGPVHGLLQAASLIRAGSVRRVVVVAGGATAKLAMNAKKHIEKGFPVLEDCLGSFAVMLEGSGRSGLRVRNDLTGMLKIGSGSSPQAVMQDLVAEPLSRAGLSFSDIDFYAPELQNPEITEAAGAGNVTLANLKMIAAMAVMKKEIEKQDMDAFIGAHGTSGWAPTQGHIPSGIPALGWFLVWARKGLLRRGMLIGKGSLFLGRMTGLFDGVSILLEGTDLNREEAEPGQRVRAQPVPQAAQRGVPQALAEAGPHKGPQQVLRAGPQPAPQPGSRLRIGLTVPGSESGYAELAKGAEEARALDPGIQPVLFGKEGGDPHAAQREMESALSEGVIQAAVTFHYPFPIGIATVGHVKAPGNGRDLFIATTTGAASPDRVEALVKNAVAGMAVARAFGIADPSLGFLNLDGAARALAVMRDLEAVGYRVNCVPSSRGDALLRGNDILAGTVDVLVCDSLTGNAIVKLLSAFSTGGKIEVSGSGYGPGVGEGAPLVGIVSRATAGSVVAAAMVFMAKMIRGGLNEVYKEEAARAEKAGLSARLRALKEKLPIRETDAVTTGPAGPAKKVVHHEIEGIDVLEIQDAEQHLLGAGIYCEPAMGCTGPVVLVAADDGEAALRSLKAAGFI